MRVLKVKVISLPYIFQILYVLRFPRSRYQVSVYRTAGPLILPIIWPACGILVIFMDVLQCMSEVVF